MRTEGGKKEVTATLGCTSLLLLLPVSLILNGLVFRTLWLWFAVPQFHLAPVSVPVAIGLSQLVSLVVVAKLPGSENDAETMGGIVATAFAQVLSRPLLFLLLGYLVHLFL